MKFYTDDILTQEVIDKIRDIRSYRGEGYTYLTVKLLMEKLDGIILERSMPILAIFQMGAEFTDTAITSKALTMSYEWHTMIIPGDPDIIRIKLKREIVWPS